MTEEEVIEFILKHDGKTNNEDERERLEAMTFTDLCLMKATITD